LGFVSPEEWRRGGSTFDWNGERVFYRAEGRGEPLLLIHGFPTASWDWCQVWPELIRHFRVLTLDLIGFGFSAKPRGIAYRISAQADLVQAFLAWQEVARYRLLAHDYGDTVAQELLARQRDGTGVAMIESACLLNGGLFPETHRPVLTQRLLASPLGGLVARLSSYSTFARSFRRICARPLSEEELRAMWRLVTENDGIRAMPRLIGYIAERRLHRERWVGALVHAPVPVRLIAGLEDPISGAHMVARYRELVPAPDVVELPGVGHYPQLEAPGEVLAAALPFLHAPTD
jgi:pimeloyl-ACP methyl ester carboxylesterase